MDHVYDKAYCIGIPDADSTNKTINGLSNQGINVELFPAINNPSQDRSCWLSHMFLWRLSLKRGFKKILVFEVGAEFERQYNPDRILDFYQEHPNFNVLFLGHAPIKVKQIEEDLVECSSLDMHAYILNLEQDDWIKGLTSMNYSEFMFPIDSLLSIQPNCYAFYPMWVVQSEKSEYQKELEDAAINGKFWSTLQPLWMNFYETGSSIGASQIAFFIVLLVFILIVFYMFYDGDQ